MEMCYDGTLVMPSSFIQMDSEEMEYTEGGASAAEWAFGIACGLIANAICAAGKYAVTSGMVATALTACASAAQAVWAGVTAAAAFIWNTPAALAILVGTVALGTGIVIGYYFGKK